MKQLLGIFLAMLTCLSWATQTPLPFPKDGRLKKVVYQPDNVVPIHGITFTLTQIIFDEEETVLDVESGDSSAWEATFHKSIPNMVFIKPTLFNSDTNMTIVTNKRNYYFHVTSNNALDSAKKQQTYVIKFIYPEEDKRRKLEALKEQASTKETPISKTYNFAYSFNGNPSLKPSKVFDDGTFTYIEFNKNQALPAVFVVDNPQGKESIVNTRQQGDYLVVLRTSPQLTLRNGGAVASIFNQAQIAAIKQNRG